MIVEDVDITPNSLKDIFADPRKKQRILKIIIQTLYNLGLDKSAAELEKQSKIIYMTPHIKAIKEALPKEDYTMVEEILTKNKLCVSEIMEILNQLKCMKIIREGNVDEALKIIQEKFSDPEKQARLAEELMIGTGRLKKQELKKKHDFIVEKCLECDISPNSMAKMINSYIQLQRQGLTKSITPEFSLLKKPTTAKSPPMRIVNVMKTSRIKEIVFLKFNPNGDKLIVISASKKQKVISLWNVNKIDEQLVETYYSGMMTDEEVIGLSWNGVESVAVAFQTKLIVFSVPQLRVLHSKRLRLGHHIKILTIQWNLLTGFLHVGGSFQSIKVFGSNLEEIMTIQPFFRTRKICFNEQGTLMFATSATKGQLVSYNLFQEKQQSSFSTSEIITSFRFQNRDKNAIIVTEKCIIYLGINYKTPMQMFQILNTFANPYGDNGLIQIQAALFSTDWLIFLGTNEFQAVSLEKNSEKMEKWNSKKSFTFDISENFMVSGSKQVILWVSGSYQDSMEEKSDESQDLMEQKINEAYSRSGEMFARFLPNLQEDLSNSELRVQIQEMSQSIGEEYEIDQQEEQDGEQEQQQQDNSLEEQS